MKIITAAALFFIGFKTQAQFAVTYINANQFVQQWLGPGVSFANALFSGTDPMQMAAFSGTTNPAIGIPDGVMLATGDAMIAGDTSVNFTNGNALGGGGDADLSGACNQQTKDLAAVEFDFWTPSDTVEFSFVFASEEYNYWVNSKNDVCGARLYNAVGGYANVIYLPGTFTPVCVNTVNNGSVANVGDPSAGPCTNCQYFFDNTYGSTFKYNGYTSVFTIKMAVTPCDTFHFWIGVADAQDFIYDSAILLPSGGFKGVNAPSISAVGYPPGTDTVSICAGTPVVLTSTASGSYSWSTGATTQQITVNTAGTYYLSSACGALSNAIVITNSAGPQLQFTAQNHICPGSCTDFLNQSVNAAAYQWFFPGAVADTSTAPDPANVCYLSSGTYDVTLIGSDGTCADTLTLPGYITVFPATIPQSIIQSGDTLTSNQGFVTYQWYHNGGVINGATDYFYVAIASGDYNVVCTDSNGCEVEAALFSVVAGITSAGTAEAVTLFPSPAAGELVVRLPGNKKISSAAISNSAGQRILFMKAGAGQEENSISLDVSALSPGLYWSDVVSGSEHFRATFMKQ